MHQDFKETSNRREEELKSGSALSLIQREEPEYLKSKQIDYKNGIV